jgi:hypothetical protein
VTPSINPSKLSRFWQALKTLQNRLAVALSIGVLFILYFTVFAVVAILAKLVGKDLLDPGQAEPGSHWLRREPVENTIESFARQF